MSTRDRNPNKRRSVKTTGVRIRKADPATWSDASTVEMVDDALIVMTQAYCPSGHSLIAADGPELGSFPAVHLKVTSEGTLHDVYLSPIHGHNERQGGDAIAAGSVCTVGCPTCDEELPDYAACPCGEGRLRAIFLTREHRDAHVAAICNVWGCTRSRIIDEWEVLSEIVDAETASA